VTSSAGGARRLAAIITSAYVGSAERGGSRQTGKPPPRYRPRFFQPGGSAAVVDSEPPGPSVPLTQVYTGPGRLDRRKDTGMHRGGARTTKKNCTQIISVTITVCSRDCRAVFVAEKRSIRTRFGAWKCYRKSIVSSEVVVPR